MLRKLRRLAKLTPCEWLLLPQLVAFSLAAGVGLRFMALPRLMVFIAQCAENRWLRCLPLLHGRCEFAQLTTLVDLAAKVTLGQGRCLSRSFLLFWLFKIRGKSAELLVGVSKESATFQAHAWIETQGRVVGDSPEMTENFATLLRL